MYRDFAPVALAALLVSACGDDAAVSSPSDQQPPSAKARVKAKGPVRLVNDLATALALPHDALCKELSVSDCHVAHNIVLGGVEAYEARIQRPPATLSVVAPIAVDRLMLSACGERAHRDFSDPKNAIVFVEVASGKHDTEARAQVVERIYDRVLARPVNATEREALVAFYDQLGGSGVDRAQTWAQLSCYAVATTTEMIFY